MTGIELTVTAQLMASQHNVIVKLSGEYDGPENTAFTRCEDRRYTVVLPVNDANYKDEALSWLRGYLDHEVGHVLFSDFDEIYNKAWSFAEQCSRANRSVSPTSNSHKCDRMRKVWQHFFNIVEDGRIERLMARMYPGSEGNLRWLSNHCFTQEYVLKCFASDHVVTASGLSVRVYAFASVLLLMMRGLIYHNDADWYLPGSALDEDITKSDCAKALEFAKRAAVLVKAEDAYSLTDDIMRFVSKMIVDDTAHDLREDVEALCNPPTPDNMDSWFSKDAQQWLDNEWDEVEQAAEMSRTAINIAKQAFDGLSGKRDGLIEKWGDSHSASLQSITTAHEIYREERKDVATIDNEEWLSAIARARDVSYRVLGNLLQAVTYRRARTSCMGTRLDTRFLTRPSCGDGRIFTRRAERIALDTNVSILLDLSGSMQGGSEREKSPAWIATTVAQGMMQAVSLLPHVTASLFGYNSLQIAKLEANQYMDATCSTPTAGAMSVAYMESMRFSNKARQVMFVITDGYPDDEFSMIVLTDYLRKQGVDLYALGIGVGACQSMANTFGKDNVLYVRNMNEFADRFSQLMMTAIMRRAA